MTSAQPQTLMAVSNSPMISLCFIKNLEYTGEKKVGNDILKNTEGRFYGGFPGAAEPEETDDGKRG